MGNAHRAKVSGSEQQQNKLKCFDGKLFSSVCKRSLSQTSLFGDVYRDYVVMISRDNAVGYRDCTPARCFGTGQSNQRDISGTGLYSLARHFSMSQYSASETCEHVSYLLRYCATAAAPNAGDGVALCSTQEALRGIIFSRLTDSLSNDCAPGHQTLALPRLPPQGGARVRTPSRFLIEGVSDDS